jgi:hypothetical protein
MAELFAFILAVGFIFLFMEIVDRFGGEQDYSSPR